ncbi:caspase domain-containing protein [Geopyxis carbonaria]|nr:caspase domain-containing protein [Geopyxis carbonaria]
MIGFTSRHDTASSSETWFVIIGVDFYPPQKRADNEPEQNVQYPNLRGSVQDACALEDFLVQELKVDHDHIVKLTSSVPTNSTSISDTLEEPPTYDNIVRALVTVEERAQTGDVVHIHYSGHGGRAKTVYPDLKDPGAFDESLVPSDIHTSGLYLRDLEFAVYLNRMVQKGLYVTVVLDSCHSGSATRNSNESYTGPIARGIEKPDETHYEFQPAHTQEIIDAGLAKYSCPDAREMGNIWLLEPRGYELLAACPAHQVAYECCETQNNKTIYNGALTRNLLEIMKDALLNNLPITHGILHQQLWAKLDKHNPPQTPIFAGNQKRVMFSTENGPDISGIKVMNIRKNKVTIAVGRIHGAQKDSEYALYRWNVTDFANTPCTAKIRITTAEDQRSEAEFMEDSSNLSSISAKDGYQAILLKQAAVRKIYVNCFPASRSQQGSALEELGRILKNSNQVMCVANEDEHADFHIGIQDNKFSLCNTKKKSLPCPETDDPQIFTDFLKHLAQFEMLRKLANPVQEYSLKDRYRFKITSSDSSDKVHNFENTTEFELLFENLHTEPLNLTILNFSPLWGIYQMFPERSAFETIDAGRSQEVPVIIEAPPELESSSSHTEFLKAFITVECTQLGNILLEDIDISGGNNWNAGRGDGDSLDELLSQLGLPTLRRLKLKSSTRNVPWATEDLTLNIFPKDSTEDKFFDAKEYMSENDDVFFDANECLKTRGLQP